MQDTWTFTVDASKKGMAVRMTYRMKDGEPRSYDFANSIAAALDLIRCTLCSPEGNALVEYVMHAVDRNKIMKGTEPRIARLQREALSQITCEAIAVTTLVLMTQGHRVIFTDCRSLCDFFYGGAGPASL